MNQELSLTDAAVTQLKKLCHEKNGRGLYVDIKPTGCSGYAYDLQVIQEPGAHDRVYPQTDNLFVAISEENLQKFIKGSILDYQREGLLNKRFVFINPNEKATCGCGESFTV